MDEGGNLSIDIVGGNILWKESIDRYCWRQYRWVILSIDRHCRRKEIVNRVHRWPLPATLIVRDVYRWPSAAIDCASYPSIAIVGLSVMGRSIDVYCPRQWIVEGIYL